MKFQVLLIKGINIVDVTDCNGWDDVLPAVASYEWKMEDDRFSIEIKNVTQEE